jgi:hypothetical protein
MRRIVLGFGDQGLYISPQRLGLGQGGNDLLVGDQLNGQVAQQRFAVRGGPAKLLILSP